MSTTRTKVKLAKAVVPELDVAQLSPATVAAIVDTVEDKDTVIQVKLTPKLAHAFVALAKDLKQSESNLAQGAIESWMSGHRRKIKGVRKPAKAPKVIQSEA